MGIVFFERALFRPSQVTNLLAWYDAADTSTITANSNLVSQWNDKSGNRYNVTQGSGALQPTTGSNTINGHNVLTFNGSVTLTNTTATNLLLLPNGNNTVFAVSTSSLDTTFEDIYAISDAGGPRNRLSYAASSQTMAFDNGNVAQVTKGSIVKSTPFILTGRRNGSNQFISVNNGTENTNASAVSASGATVFAIGSDNSVSGFLTGKIAEIIIFNRSLSASEIAQINRYLSRKWSIAIS